MRTQKRCHNIKALPVWYTIRNYIRRFLFLSFDFFFVAREKCFHCIQILMLTVDKLSFHSETCEKFKHIWWFWLFNIETEKFSRKYLWFWMNELNKCFWLHSIRTGFLKRRSPQISQFWRRANIQNSSKFIQLFSNFCMCSVSRYKIFWENPFKFHFKTSSIKYVTRKSGFLSPLLLLLRNLYGFLRAKPYIVKNLRPPLA